MKTAATGAMAATTRAAIFHVRRHAHTLIARGDIQSVRKCRFQATLIAIDSTDDVAAALATVRSEKRVSKASHPHIAAWRAPAAAAAAASSSAVAANDHHPNPVTSAPLLTCGFDDGGESGAGQRLAQLLEARNDIGVLVAVTRWYGGTPLGSARFRAITSAAKTLLKQQGRVSQ